MELAFITPTAFLEQFAVQGDLYLALAHLVDDNGENEYASFHRREAEQGRRVILDNGLFEGSQVTSDQLLRRATSIKASCVCAPDVLYDSKGTIKAFKQFIRDKQDFGLCCEVMGVPQADNPADWWECFQFMDMHTDCDVIGLSILSVPKSFGRLAKGPREHPITTSRVHLIQQLYSYSDLSQHRLKPIHLLGLGETFDDIKEAKRLLNREVVSNDSSSAFVHGDQSIRFTRDGVVPGGKDLRKLDFHLKRARDSKSIQENINTALTIARSDPWR